MTRCYSSSCHLVILSLECFIFRNPLPICSTHPHHLQERIDRRIGEPCLDRIIVVLTKVAFLHKPQLFQHPPRPTVGRVNLGLYTMQPHAREPKAWHSPNRLGHHTLAPPLRRQL